MVSGVRTLRAKVLDLVAGRTVDSVTIITGDLRCPRSYEKNSRNIIDDRILQSCFRCFGTVCESRAVEYCIQRPG